MHEKDNYLKTAELSTEQNCNMIDGVPNNTPIPRCTGPVHPHVEHLYTRVYSSRTPGCIKDLFTSKFLFNHLHFSFVTWLGVRPFVRITYGYSIKRSKILGQIKLSNHFFGFRCAHVCNNTSYHTSAYAH